MKNVLKGFAVVAVCAAMAGIASADRGHWGHERVIRSHGPSFHVGFGIGIGIGVPVRHYYDPYYVAPCDRVVVEPEVVVRPRWHRDVVVVDRFHHRRW